MLESKGKLSRQISIGHRGACSKRVYNQKCIFWLFRALPLAMYPQKFRNFACSQFPRNCERKPNNILIEKKELKIVKFSGTAQSSSGFPKN
jgi:hypothetical protein